MDKKILWVSLTIAFFLTMAAESQAQVDWPHGSAVDTFVTEQLAALDIPGAALAIVQNGEIVHLQGYGVANPAGDPMTPETPILLASLSKSMTAVAVMQLVEAGQIDLEAPVQQYLPWFMPDTPITVRQLLNQTSGLDEAAGYERNLDPDGPDALAQSLRRLADADLNRPPGTAFEYSNSNYDLLGLLVETVSGQSYGDYLEDHIFAPLGMVQAATSLADARAAGMSSSYYPFFGRPTAFDARLPYSRATQPSAGVIGSAADVSRYLLFHMGDGNVAQGQLLSPAGMATLHAPAVATSPDEDAPQYAMGWAVWEWPDAAEAGSEPPTALSHGGRWLGAHHIMLFLPEKNFGLVLLLNSNDPSIASAYSNIAFDTALVALGRAPQHYPPNEDWLSRRLRLLSAGLILVLFLMGVWAWRTLRRPRWTRGDRWLLIILALIDLSIVAYTFFIRLPQNQTSVNQVLRFEPDLGLMLILILLLTLGWGTVRTVWAVRRWRTAGLIVRA